MSELRQACVSGVPTLSNLTSTAENKITFIEMRQELADEIVDTKETAGSEPDWIKSLCRSQLLKTGAVPLAPLVVSLPECGDGVPASQDNGDNVTFASLEDDTKCRQLDDEEPSLEDHHGWAEKGTLSSTCAAPLATQQLGLDKCGRSYWPGRYPQVSVFLPPSNCPASEHSWWRREWASPSPQASMITDDSCVYLYGRTSRFTTSPAGTGGKASRACLAMFIFVVVMLCVWMFQAVGEYRVPESALYTRNAALSANKVKGGGGTYAGEVLPHADGARRAENIIQQILSYNDSEDAMNDSDSREKNHSEYNGWNDSASDVIIRRGPTLRHR
ncbi:hypothetical protein HPB51_028395 [Rhipicephalus microplus]|uniref:Transmembrane protein n=1 Tax=Rhipicephalus microplus TaxID=6941 RepID=A0A9J6CXF4_RHIMP|nr:hypothetical protein HPB51_028395 [Rhipicephalus microplus]